MPIINTNVKDITVVGIETRREKVPQLIEILKNTRTAISALESVLVTSREIQNELQAKHKSICFVATYSPITNNTEYSMFILEKLGWWFRTKHCLLVQWDGFVINPAAWTDEFLEYDYIGAPWKHSLGIKSYPQHPMVTKDNIVGNGGFSLRSSKLCYHVAEKYNELYDPCISDDIFYPEDNFICLSQRDWLIGKGMKFAPVEVAERFSVENELYKGSLGFHGPMTIKMNIEAGIFKT